ncbi:MAG: LacI family transcriptional regulator [Segetibacter sp.]|jgi:LacI family transcriptional regulator|nr:LacI family transcriptional regulator [Segetibacter sp.]
MPEINIRALAKELNLSIGTVSKALKDSYEISAETKRRVLEVAKKLHYAPNPYASSLRRKKSNTIAVVVPEVADSYFSQAIKGIEEIAQLKGYHVLVYLTYESYAREKQILDEFTNGRVDGLLISVSSETCSTGHIEALNSNKVPVVFFDRAIDETDAAKITTNDYDSGYEATRHLIERGCRKIAYLSISNLLVINTKRMMGFRNAMTDSKLHVDDNNIVNCSNDDNENNRILTEVLKQKNRADGIISSVEKLITPVYTICKQLKLQIPADLKVLCFSNLSTAHILNPSLTTITQPAFDMGKMAATVLFKAVEKRNYNWQDENLVIPSKLYIRDSTGG